MSDNTRAPQQPLAFINITAWPEGTAETTMEADVILPLNGTTFYTDESTGRTEIHLADGSTWFTHKTTTRIAQTMRGLDFVEVTVRV